MKNLLAKLEWILDYYVLYFTYNPNKIDRYHTYMDEKWFKRSEQAEQLDKHTLLLIKEVEFNSSKITNNT